MNVIGRVLVAAVIVTGCGPGSSTSSSVVQASSIPKDAAGSGQGADAAVSADAGMGGDAGMNLDAGIGGDAAMGADAGPDGPSCDPDRGYLCPLNQHCNAQTGRCEAGCDDDPVTCSRDQYCPANQNPGARMCVNGCLSDSTCSLGKICEIPNGQTVGTCTDGCRNNDNSYCPLGKLCSSGRCVDGCTVCYPLSTDGTLSPYCGASDAWDDECPADPTDPGARYRGCPSPQICVRPYANGLHSTSGLCVAIGADNGRDVGNCRTDDDCPSTQLCGITGTGGACSNLAVYDSQTACETLRNSVSGASYGTNGAHLVYWDGSACRRGCSADADCGYGWNSCSVSSAPSTRCVDHQCQPRPRR